MDFINEIRNNQADFVNEAVMYASPNIEGKKTIMSIMSHNKQCFVNESFSYDTAANTLGVGAITMPGNPTTLDGFHTQTPGSADTPALLGMSMAMMATTIALDLVPIAPAATDLIQLEYTDVVYSGTGKANLSGTEKPAIFTVISAELFAATLTKGDVITIYNDGGAAVKVKFIQKHRFLADQVIVGFVDAGTYVESTNTLTSVATQTLTSVAAVADTYRIASAAGVAGTFSFDLTSAINNDTELAANNMDYSGDPMNREDAEDGNSVTVEFKTYKKNVDIKSYQVIGKMTRAQKRQFDQKGLDGIPMIRKTLQGLASQAINDLILRRMRKLGVSNHYNLFMSQGVNLNLFIANPATANKALTAFGVPAFYDKAGIDRTAAFGNIVNAESNSSAENLHTRQGRISSKIQAAAGLIGHVSRHGAADACVVNSQIYAALKISTGFTPVKYEGAIIQDVKSLYYAGDLAGVKVFCNPKMAYNDNTIMVARTNKSADGLDYEDLKEGIVFCPQDLAATVEIVAEGTMSYKILLESLFAIAEVGLNPEQAYLTFAVNTGYAGGSWT